MQQTPSRYLMLLGITVGFIALSLVMPNAWAQVEQSETSAVSAEETPAETATEAEIVPAKTEVVTEAIEPGVIKPSETEATEEETEAAELAAANAAPVSTKTFTYVVNSAIMFVCAVLVLLMQAGFTLVEVGLNSAKNAANILAKNIMDLCVGAVIFMVVGFGLMYPGYNEGGLYGFGGVGLGGLRTVEAEDGTTSIAGDDENLSANYAPSADFLFQVAFAATAATIVSGAVAGRMKFSGYLIYTMILTGFVYPISGMWRWGEGWLYTLGFQDFAGSIIVHAVGGFAGLAGAMLLGPRIGRYVNGKSIPMPGHNIVYAGLGVFLLWVGWFGFNPGSQLTYASTLEISHTLYIAITTTMAGAAGAIVAMLVVWVMFGKPDVSMMLNGALAGLVGITANCDNVTILSALMIGGIAGVIVVMGVVLLDKLKIDDPVGAFPVHGLCGIWGGLATGVFGVNIPEVCKDSRFEFIKVQAIGTVAIIAWAFFAMLIVFGVLKVLGLLRVSPEHELEGLDVTEHGMHAYPPSWVAADDFGAGPTTTMPVMYSQSANADARVEVSPGSV